MGVHAEIALDQLRLADSCANDRQLARSDEHLGYLAKAIVHAILDVAQAVREENAAVNAAIQAAEQQADAEIWHETENRLLSPREMEDLAAEWTRQFGD